MKTLFRPALVLFFMLTLFCTLLYPLLVTVMGQLAFPKQVQGSILMYGGKAIGSSLIGQPFSSPKYVWGRPSATRPVPYNATASQGSGLGPANPLGVEQIRNRVLVLRAADPQNPGAIPVDLVTASASGLDPEISLAAAFYQASRVASERHLAIEQVKELIIRQSTRRYFHIFGEPRVNVLELNLALDKQVLSGPQLSP